VPKPGTFEHHQDISFFAFNFEVAASANMRRSSLDLEENDVEEIEVAARHKADLRAIYNLEDRGRHIESVSLLEIKDTRKARPTSVVVEGGQDIRSSFGYLYIEQAVVMR
jgi:hypothetical protein